MSLRIKSAKLTGNPDASGWTQVHDFEPREKEKLETRGRLFAVISAGDSSIGREILTRINEEYYGDLGLAAYDALKNALKKIVGEFGTKANLSVCLAAVVQDIVYLAVTGKGEAKIFRNGNLASIVKGSSGQVLSASGRPRQGDLLIQTTGDLVTDAPFSSGSPDLIVEALAPALHSKADQGICGLVVVKFDDWNAREEELSKTVEEAEGAVEQNVPQEPPPRPARNFRRLFSKGVYVKLPESDIQNSQKRKVGVLVGMILLTLLVMSIGFGIRQQSVKNARVEFEGRLAEASHNLEEAKNLFILNPDRARELFAASSQIVDNLLSDFPDSEEIKKLKQEIDDGRQTVLGEFDTAPDEFLDLSLIDGLEAEKMAATADVVYVYDKAKKRIVEVEIGTKKTEVKVGPSQLNAIEALAAYSGRIFVVEDEGIIEVEASRSKVVEKNWSGEVLLYAYAGNLYLLEKGASKIWRYSAITGGFSDGREWLAPGIKVDLSRVVGWAIDGTVWLLTETGKVEKYSFGSPQDIKDMSPSPDFGTPKVIYTNEELANVYILDPSTERIVVFDKEGNYKAQYKSDILKDALSLAASEKVGRILVLTKDKLYSFPISQ